MSGTHGLAGRDALWTLGEGGLSVTPLVFLEVEGGRPLMVTTWKGHGGLRLWPGPSRPSQTASFMHRPSERETFVSGVACLFSHSRETPRVQRAHSILAPFPFLRCGGCWGPQTHTSLRAGGEAHRGAWSRVHSGQRAPSSRRLQHFLQTPGWGAAHHAVWPSSARGLFP